MIDINGRDYWSFPNQYAPEEALRMWKALARGQTVVRQPVYHDELAAILTQAGFGRSQPQAQAQKPPHVLPTWEACNFPPHPQSELELCIRMLGDHPKRRAQLARALSEVTGETWVAGK